MDSLLGTVAPLAVVAGIAGAIYVCQSKKSGKSSKSKKATSPTVKDTVDDELDEDLLQPKKKKQAPIAAKIDFGKKNEPKAKKAVVTPESTAPVAVASPVPTPPVSPQPEMSKKDKKAAAKAKSPEPVAVVAPAKKEKKLTEVEELKLRLAELEAKASSPPSPPSPPQQPQQQQLSNKQLKKLAKAEAEAAAAAAAAAAAKKDDKKAKEHNPAPQLTEEQKKEQADALAQFQKEQSQWREIPQDNRRKEKKDKVKIDYVDLSVLTTQSTMTARFGDRSVLLKSEPGSPTPLDQISSNTGCKIELQQRPPKEFMDKAVNHGFDLPMKIDLEGTEQQIIAARNILNELITKGFSQTLTPNIVEVKLRIDPSDHFQIIGKGGSTLHQIMDATGVKITVPKQAKEGQVADDIVRIVGSTEAVHQAKEAIKSLITNGFSDLTHDNWKKLVIDFPTTYRRYILQGGPNSIIRSIEANSTCKVNLPTSPSENTIAVVGPAAKVDGAAIDIKAVLAKLDQPVNDVYLVGFDSADFKNNELW